MQVDCIPFQQTGYFSELICDYLEEKDALKPFFNRFPNIENFGAQLKEKNENFDLDKRAILANALQSQYANFEISELAQEQIESLKD